MEPNEPADPAPSAQPRRNRHTRAQRTILAINVVLAVVCLAAAIGLVYGKHELDGRLQTAKVVVSTTTATTVPRTTDAVTGSTELVVVESTFPPADPQAQNFLIAGSDNNPCVDPDSPWAGAADSSRESIGSRSDAIMVFRVDPVSRGAAILSFPRDLWVRIPTKGNGRINTAYVKDDYSLLAQTLYDNFGIVVDHYIQIDFCAFKRIVDAVDGVAVPFDNPIRDRAVGLEVAPKPGEALPFCHTFNGDEALAYVRSRHLKWIDEDGKSHEDLASDFGRITRQQDFLRRVLQRALDKGLIDPKVARGIIESLQTDIVTESGFTVDDMLMFAGLMHDVAPSSIRTYQVESTSANVSGSSVRMPALKGENMKAILAIFQGKAPLYGAPEEPVIVDPTGTSTASTVAGPTSTVVQPEENLKGQIIPPREVQC